jgi:ADP-ribosylglycohydrolase
MKHLLLTRFQGGLIGGNIIYTNSQQLAPNQLIIDATLAVMNGINSLTHQSKFADRDWLQNTLITTANPERAIVAMLPLMLFFHDDRVKLREILINVSHSWELDWETCSSAVAIGYIISRSIAESFNPRTILSQLLDETINLHPLVFQELSTIDRLLDRASSLHQVTQGLTTILHPIVTPTILGIYCFLSTPEDFSLATRRAARIADRSQLTCALTGILGGVHNGLAGIPLNGYIATQERSQWLLRGESLLSAWAGVYHEHSASSSISVLPAFGSAANYPFAVASPRVMQRRD